MLNIKFETFIYRQQQENEANTQEQESQQEEGKKEQEKEEAKEEQIDPEDLIENDADQVEKIRKQHLEFQQYFIQLQMNA